MLVCFIIAVAELASDSFMHSFPKAKSFRKKYFHFDAVSDKFGAKSCVIY